MPVTMPAGRVRRATGRSDGQLAAEPGALGRVPRARPLGPTARRILDAALESFAQRGYEATSLDQLARALGVRKQTILYWFSSKEALLEAVIDDATAELSATLETALEGAGEGFARVEAVVRSVFRLAARRPALISLVREVSRLGPPAALRMAEELAPLVARAIEFLQAEMDVGRFRRHDPRLLLLAIYSTVVGMVTEVETGRLLGEEPTLRSLVRRRSEIVAFLRSALEHGAARGSALR